MRIDKENAVGSFHRSASWQVTHMLKGLSPERRQEFQQKLELHEAASQLFGLPVNQQLLAITKQSLKEVEQCQ